VLGHVNLRSTVATYRSISFLIPLPHVAGIKSAIVRKRKYISFPFSLKIQLERLRTFHLLYRRLFSVE